MRSNVKDWVFLSCAHCWKQDSSYWVSNLTFQSVHAPFKKVIEYGCIFSIRQYAHNRRPDWCDLQWEEDWDNRFNIIATPKEIQLGKPRACPEARQLFLQAITRLLQTPKPSRSTGIQWCDPSQVYAPGAIGHHHIMRRKLPVKTLTRHLDWESFGLILKYMDIRYEQLPKPLYLEALHHLL